MEFILLMIIIALMGFVWIVEKNIYSPMFILLGIWTIIIALCYINEYNYIISEKTYYIVMNGLISSFVGYIVTESLYMKNEIDNIVINEQYLINKGIYLLIFLFQLIGLVVLVSFAIIVKNLVANGVDYYTIRYSYLDKVFSNQISGLLYSYIIRPGLVFLMPLTIYNILTESKNKLFVFMFMTEVISIFLVVYNLGERYIFMDFTICLMVIFLIIRNQRKDAKIKKIVKKTRRLTILAFFAFLIVFFIVTNGRGSDARETFYTYLSGCLPHMSLKVESFDFVKDYTYGVTSFQGFLRPLYKVLEFWGFHPASNGLFHNSEMHKAMIEAPVYIGNHILFNGFISMFFYFYVDMGNIGVSVISFMVSVIICHSYMKIKYKPNKYNLLHYCLLISIYSSSFFQFGFSSLNLALALIMFYIYRYFSCKRNVQ